MSTAEQTLKQKMQERLSAGGYEVVGGRDDLFMEVIDTTTGQVWMSAAAVAMSDYAALELDASLAKVGIATAPMDCAAFQHSPEAPEGPVLEREINGLTYINVAAPMERKKPSQPGGPLEIAVNKAHVIGFDTGRSVAVLSLPAGDFVEVVGDDSDDKSLLLPPGAGLKRIKLREPWLISLPTPTRTFFWMGENMRSFQGPVDLSTAVQDI